MNGWAYILAQAEPEARVESQVEFARWTVGIGLVAGVLLIAAVLYGVWWLYRHEGRGTLSAKSRRGLIGLRCAMLLLLGLIGLEPVLARYLHRHIAATTLLLVDDSASMSVRDHYRQSADQARLVKLGRPVPAEGLSRTELARDVLRRDHGAWVRALAARNRVQAYSFSDGSTPMELRPSASQPGADFQIDLRSLGPATDPGRAIRAAIRGLGGSPIAAVVMLSDGGFNYGEPADVLGRYLASRHIPLYAVGLGDPAEPVNVRVTEIAAPRNAFTKDPFTVTVQIAAEGLGGEPVNVELTRRAAGTDAESAEVVERRTVHPGADGDFEPLRFECRVEKAGPVVFAARVPPLPFEAVETDNVRETAPPVQVLDRKMRVLMVAGAPTYEYRYLARLLERDQTVDVSCWLQSADPRAVRDGDIVIDHLPMTTDELFQYDVVLLMDADPSGLTAEWAVHVASLVEEFGGGLLFAADRKYTTQFLRDPRLKPLVDLLPIVADPDAELILNQLGQYQRVASPLLISPEAAVSPLLRQADSPAESLEAWSLLDGVYWHYPVRREKPAATVLMRHGNPRMAGATGPCVLYATQYVGAGRSAWVGFNSTWRWRRYGDEYFERFWIPAIRYLTEGKLLGGKQRGSLSTERDQYSVGDTVVVTLRALNEEYQPLRAESFEMTVAHAHEEPRRITLSPIAGRDGFYQGRFVADRVGSLTASVALPGRSGTTEPITQSIVVNQPDLELRRPVMRRDLLARLAEESGGRYFDIDEADKLPALIEDRGESYVLKERPTPLWDNGWVYGALIGLLTVEWIWRKWAKLL